MRQVLVRRRRRPRQVVRTALAGWALAGLSLALAVVMSLVAGVGGARSQERVRASERLAEQSQQRFEALEAQLTGLREAGVVGPDLQASVEPR